MAADGKAELAIEGGAKSVTLTKEMISFSTAVQRVSERKYVPNVIEPSFGVGRIITGILEHNFSVREGDEQRAVLSFAPIIAPFKAVLLPLDARIPRGAVHAIASSLTAAGLANTVDETSASVGKRYSRADEIGIPFAITYDHESAAENTVTLRERDTCAQIRLPIADVPSVIRARVEESTTWADLCRKYTVVTSGEDKAASASATLGAGSSAAAPSSAAEAVVSAVTVADTKPNGKVGAHLEGEGRSYGRFFRPNDMK